MHDKPRSFLYKYLQFYYKHTIRSEKNEPSQYFATDDYITFIILNEH